MYVNRHPMKYEIGELNRRIKESTVRLEHIHEHKGTLDHICNKVGAVIEGMNLVRLPVTWSSYYPRNTWSEVRPTIIVNGSLCSLHEQETVNDKSGLMVAIRTGRGVIHVDAAPCWDVWRRWPTIVIEQFYDAMREIRKEFGSPAMEDLSKTEAEYDWEQLAFMYETKTPVHTSVEHVDLVDRHGDPVRELVTEFYLFFRLEIPNPPSDFKGKLFGCQVEKTEVLETRVHTKKRMVCE